MYASEPTFGPSGTESPVGDAGGCEVEDYPLDPDAPTAIDLHSFEAFLRRDAALVAWQTILEVDILGFNIYRSNAPEGAAVKINDEIILSQVIGGPYGAAYTFLDPSAVFGETYSYWLESEALDGSKVRHGLDRQDQAGYDLFLSMIR